MSYDSRSLNYKRGNLYEWKNINANSQNPEEQAWNLIRNWAAKNLSDYKARCYIGCAPKGHHSEGEEHSANENEQVHPYMAQMILFKNEGEDDKFLGADVCDGPNGLFLTGDVIFDEFNDDGTIDVGTCMEKAYGVMAKYLNDIENYRFELDKRLHFEEHIFSDDWVDGYAEVSKFKLWLPIRRI